MVKKSTEPALAAITDPLQARSALRGLARVIRDTDGVELTFLRQAIEEAEASATSIAKPRKYMPTKRVVEIRNQEGLILAVVPVFTSS